MEIPPGGMVWLSICGERIKVSSAGSFESMLVSCLGHCGGQSGRRSKSERRFGLYFFMARALWRGYSEAPGRHRVVLVALWKQICKYYGVKRKVGFGILFREGIVKSYLLYVFVYWSWYHSAVKFYTSKRMGKVSSCAKDLK